MTPELVKADWLGDYRIRLEFEDGCTGVLDLAGRFGGPVFEPLQDVALFRQFRLVPEWNTISWPTGADLAPEYLYEQASSNPVAGADRERGPASPEEVAERADDASLAAATGGSRSASDAER